MKKVLCSFCEEEVLMPYEGMMNFCSKKCLTDWEKSFEGSEVIKMNNPPTHVGGRLISSSTLPDLSWLDKHKK